MKDELNRVKEYILKVQSAELNLSQSKSCISGGDATKRILIAALPSSKLHKQENNDKIENASLSESDDNTEEA